MELFIGMTAKSRKLKPMNVKDFKDACTKYFNNPLFGDKDGLYFTTASEVSQIGGDYNRNDTDHIRSWSVVIDGDKTTDSDDCCLPPEDIHKTLKRLKINHCIYTSFSYEPKIDKFKWRLIVPCQVKGVEQHRASVAHLHKLLFDKGHEKLVAVSESFRMSQLWYLHRSDHPEDFLFFEYHKGIDFVPQDEFPADWVKVPHTTEETNNTPAVGTPAVPSGSSVSEGEMIALILSGGSPLHQTMNNYIYGRTKDGMLPGAIKAHLHAFTAGWNLSDQRLASRKKDIDRLVDFAKNKFCSDQSHWDSEDPSSTEPRAFTSYPDQGGMMQELVDCCMNWMIFPNQQIAVTAARTVISALGSRVYTYEGGKGIALTALLTGRSTIGKSNIKKFFIWLMDNFQLANVSHEYLGAQYYTSVKNMVEDLSSKNSLLSVRTESGQSDKSSAGDMSRVMTYELEFSTESGSAGYISAGAQNDKIPALYSPAVTTIRESVAKIQSDADVLNQTTVSGMAGRRSLIIIDPVKGDKNNNRITKIPSKIKKWLTEMYKLSCQTERLDCTKPLKADLWNYIEVANPSYLEKLEAEWVHLENEAAMREDDYESTFYGRLYERVPAYAGSLAIADNPLKPVVTETHIDIAIESLTAELRAHRVQETTGALDDPLTRAIKQIVRLFEGKMDHMMTYYKPALKKVAKEEIAGGALEWVPIYLKLKRHLAPLDKRDKESFFRSLGSRLRASDIEIMSKDETLQRYGHKRMTLRRL